MPDPSDILPVDQLKADPGFMGLPYATKQAAVSRMLQQDPGFASLDAATQAKAASKTINVHALGVLPEETPVKDAVKDAVKSAFDWQTGAPTADNVRRGSEAVLKNVLPAAGLVAGAPFGPAGMALGAAAGAEGSNLISQSLGDRPAPQTAMDALKQTAGDLSTGATAAIGDKVAQVGTEALMATGPAIRTAAGQLADKANALGIRLAPDQLSENPIIGFIGSLLRKFPGTSTVMAKASAARATAMNNVSGDILDELGTLATKSEQGEAIQNVTAAAPIARLQTTKNKSYDLLEKSAQSVTKLGTLANVDAVKAAAYQDISQIPDNLLPDPDAVAKIKGFLAPNPPPPAPPPSGLVGPNGLPLPAPPPAPPAPTQMSAYGMLALRKNLNAFLGDAIDSPAKVIVNRVKSALDQDIGNLATETGGAFEEHLAKANQGNSNYMELKNNPFVKQILKSRPEDVVNKFMTPGNVSSLQVLKTVTDPKDWAEHVEPAIVNRLFSTKTLEPSDVAEMGPAGATAVAFKKNMRLYPKEQLETLLPPGTLSRLGDFDEVMNAVLKSPDVLAGNASGTATSFIGQGVGPLAAANFIIKNPVTGIPVILSSPVLATMWLTKAGQEIITEGFKPILKGVAIAGARAAGVATAIKLMEKASAAPSASQPPAPPSPNSGGSGQAAPLPIRPGDPSALDPRMPPLGEQAMGERGQIKAFLGGDMQGALDAAQSTYAKFPESVASRRMIERIYQKRRDTAGMKKALGEK